jgi:hypothetical protein
MVRHSAVVYHDDSSAQLHRIDFAHDGWLDYVPIQMADTVCVLERLPDRAAAVLINRGHTFRDIFLPISAIEKRLFDEIDGKQSIAEIVRAIAPSPEETVITDLARDFFNQLWWQDQVLFDTSDLSERSRYIE